MKILFIFLIFSLSSIAQVQIEWQRSHGGSLRDMGQSIITTIDGGFLCVGGSESIDGDISNNIGTFDFWITKLDSIGEIQWQKSLGGSFTDQADDVKQTADGGYIISGVSNSNDVDVTGNHGSGDCWLVKIDSIGNIEWQKSLGGSLQERTFSVNITEDGGYIVGGSSLSSDGDLTTNNGSLDFWIVKLNPLGIIEWQKSLGGSNIERINSILQAEDGGYIAAGVTYSNNGDISFSHGGVDAWVVKLDSTGILEWEKTFGGSSNEEFHSIRKTLNGDYILAGNTYSSDGDVVSTNGSGWWVVKINSTGDILWEQTYGGYLPNDIELTSEGGYIVVGRSTSDNGYVSNHLGASDYWIIKIDSTGNLEWEKTLGGPDEDLAFSIKEIEPNRYVVFGYSETNGLEATGNNGWFDYWLVKIHAYNVFGKVYFDADQDCFQDVSEEGINGINLIINPGGYVVTTNNSGYWGINSLPVGNYNITVDTTTNWSSVCMSTQPLNVTASNTFISAPDFGVIYANPCTEPDVSISVDIIRSCDTSRLIYVQACNGNTSTGIINSAYVDVQLDSLITPTNSSIPYTSLGNNSYRFNLGDMFIGECINFTISTTISCDAINGQTLCMTANLFPVDSCALDTIPSSYISSSTTPPLIAPVPCMLPWDNSSLIVEGWCQNDSVVFSVTNIGDLGNGDMECYSPIFIYVNDTLVSVDSVMIQGQQTVYYSYPTNGETWVFQTEQHPLHPGNSHPNAHVEACGVTINNWIPNLINNQPLDDSDPNIDIFCKNITGSYDPNDKTGYPIGISEEHFIKSNQQLQYNIRFQNTGTDTAFTVIIRDTLDPNLNLFTVTPGVSSHNYSFQMYGPRVLEWKFDNILLTDSTTNEPDSHGFITFHVNQVPNLINGTVINNSADIYFDFNEPIITNETVHIINNSIQASPLEIQEFIIDNGSLLTVYPNPNDGILFIELEKYSLALEYSILDLNGRSVVSGQLAKQKNALNLQHLKSGVYLIQIDEMKPIRMVKQ